MIIVRGGEDVFGLKTISTIAMVHLIIRVALLRPVLIQIVISAVMLGIFSLRRLVVKILPIMQCGDVGLVVATLIANILVAMKLLLSVHRQRVAHVIKDAISEPTFGSPWAVVQ